MCSELGDLTKPEAGRLCLSSEDKCSPKDQSSSPGQESGDETRVVPQVRATGRRGANGSPITGARMVGALSSL